MENNGLNIDHLMAEAKQFGSPSKLIGFEGLNINSVPRPKRISYEDMIIGAISNYGPEDIEQWIVSINKSGFAGKKIALIYNAKQPVLDKLQENGFVIWALARANEQKAKEGWVYYYKDMDQFNICMERFWHIWVFLKKLGLSSSNDVRVFLTDTKDVVFQKNPSNFEFDDGKEILLSSEGLTYRNEPWGWNNLNQAFGKNVAENLADREIFNAGVIAGRLNDVFLDFLQSVYFYARGAKTINGHVPGGGGADQASLNILLNQRAWHSLIQFTSIMEEWNLNAGTTNDPNKNFPSLIGVPGFLTKPEDQDGLFVMTTGVKTVAGSLYHIVHQYDRNPEWKEYFKKEFSYK